jgi:hypothetical protein
MSRLLKAPAGEMNGESDRVHVNALSESDRVHVNALSESDRVHVDLVDCGRV